MKEFIEKMPKAELHVHLEGTLEPEHIFSLAQRNNIELDYSTPEEVIAAYDFHDLPSFLTIYYAAMNVLRTEQDFYEDVFFGCFFFLDFLFSKKRARDAPGCKISISEQ